MCVSERHVTVQQGRYLCRPQKSAAHTGNGGGHDGDAEACITLRVVRDKERPRVPTIKQETDEDGPDGGLVRVCEECA